MWGQSMTQRPTDVTVEPDPSRRALRAALRALLLLGGTVAVWLLLSAAPAQADDVGSRAAGPVLPEPVAAAASATTGQVDKATRGVSDAVRRLPATTDEVTTEVTAPAPEPVRSSIAAVSAAVTPTLSEATTVVADTIDRASVTVQGVVEPLVEPSAVTAAPIRAAAVADKGLASAVSGHVIDAVSAPAPIDLGRSIADALGAVGAGVWSDVSGLPVPDAPVLPSSISTGSWSGAAIALLGLLLVLPVMGRRRIGHDVAALPLGPAYPPGSSPD
jgi:hypothetical protein